MVYTMEKMNRRKGSRQKGSLHIIEGNFLQIQCTICNKEKKRAYQSKYFKPGNSRNKKWQVTYIAPLNHLPLLPSGPGGVQQELVV
jgi:hypothetical protein